MIQNIATQKMIQALKEQIMKEQFDEKYPVGNGHYVQFQGMAEPSVAFAKYGGTWEIDNDYTGRVLVGAGNGYTIGSTGGSSNHNHEAGSLLASIHFSDDNVIYYKRAEDRVQLSNAVSFSIQNQGTGSWGAEGTSIVGSTENSSTMQPYKVVAVWKRTA